MVYAAAKVMFARATDVKLVYDLSGDCGAAGASPWEHTCSTSCEWAACFARRYVEASEGTVDDDFVDETVVSRARYLLNVLREAGVRITDDITSLVCHDSEPLIAQVSTTVAA
jgi:hypothetical protein